jgi:hypothetical protein
VTYRLVRVERRGQKVRAVTRLNPGRHFALPRAVARTVRPPGGVTVGAIGAADDGQYPSGRSGAPATGLDGAMPRAVTNAGAVALWAL